MSVLRLIEFQSCSTTRKEETDRLQLLASALKKTKQKQISKIVCILFLIKNKIKN